MRRLSFVWIMVPMLLPALLLAGSRDGTAPASPGAVQIVLQEHPEHPGGGHEHPGSESKTHEHGAVTIEEVAAFVEDYAAKESSKHDGWMEIRDEDAGRTLKLNLDKVHRDRLAKTGEGTYFVCADFKTPEGKVYDIDFWVKETDKGLGVTETTIHKEDGRPRYNWVEKDGIWSRQPVKEEKGEHKEGEMGGSR